MKCGGKRPKALFGEAITAGAILTAAGMQTAATASAAKQQAKAAVESANIQAQSIKEQTNNNTSLQKESINFTRQQNQENRQQQQDIQTTLQMLAGRENMNDRMEANKVAVKYGGRPKRFKLKSQPSYGGGNLPFKVTDGGGVLPLNIDNQGYGLYEIYGNDHEHYHKTQGGKNKTGVGIKFPDGAVVEGEGNQNTNQGELLYVTPNDAVFISKHSIDGFNPAQAVNNGVDPLHAFNIQEKLKQAKGLNDDGTKTRKAKFGTGEVISDFMATSLPIYNTTAPIAAGVAYLRNNDIAKCGGRYSIKGRRKAVNGTSVNGNFWNNYGGATINAGANIAGALIGVIGNSIASKKLGQAYGQAAETIANAYRQYTTIDEDFLNREDYAAPKALAVIRSADTNINPQLERIRRNTAYERNEINRNTLSSAARQQRIAATNDRASQRIGEQYAIKYNADEAIKQENAKALTQTITSNADREVQANRDYTNARLSLKQYNNDIMNQKLAGIAQAYADSSVNTAATQGQMLQSSMGMLGSALTASASGFGSTIDGIRQERNNLKQVLSGADTEAVVRTLIMDINGNNGYNRQLAENMFADYDARYNSLTPTEKSYYNRLATALGKPIYKLI